MINPYGAVAQFIANKIIVRFFRFRSKEKQMSNARSNGCSNQDPIVKDRNFLKVFLQNYYFKK